jgi:hypothetical protein
MDSLFEPMVVLPHGSSPSPSLGSYNLKVVCFAIATALLGKLSDITQIELTVNKNCSKEDSPLDTD